MEGQHWQRQQQLLSSVASSRGGGDDKQWRESGEGERQESQTRRKIEGPERAETRNCRLWSLEEF